MNHKQGRRSGACKSVRKTADGGNVPEFSTEALRQDSPLIRRQLNELQAKRCETAQASTPSHNMPAKQAMPGSPVSSKEENRQKANCRFTIARRVSTR